MSARALVTGAAGFVGASLARALIAAGHEVTLVVRPGSDTWRIDGIRDAAVASADMTDALAVADLLQRTRPEFVFHLAAYGAYERQSDATRIAAVNVLGAANLLAGCVSAGVRVVVNTGSSSEYGAKDHPPAETEALDPNSYYAATKAAATYLWRQAARQHGLSTVTLRLYSVYGPYEDPGRLIPTLIVSGLDGRLPPMADPEIARDFVHVDDVVRAYLLAAERPHAEVGPIYNVGTGRQVRLREAVEVARDILGVVETPRWGSMPSRHWDTTVWVSDPRRAHEVLGWRAEVSFREGFRRTVEWFRSETRIAERYRASVRA